RANRQHAYPVRRLEQRRRGRSALGVPGARGPRRETEMSKHSLRALILTGGLLTQACTPSDDARTQAQTADGAAAETAAPITVSGSYWIELSPVLVAANSFYRERLPVGEGGITRITAGEA